jgi:hypothetical protein
LVGIPNANGTKKVISDSRKSRFVHFPDLHTIMATSSGKGNYCSDFAFNEYHIANRNFSSVYVGHVSSRIIRRDLEELVSTSCPSSVELLNN